MKVKALPSFKSLSISGNYQGLHSDDYFALKRGEIVELKSIPEVCKIHLEKVKAKKGQ